MPKKQEKDKLGTLCHFKPTIVFYLTAYCSRNPHRDPAFQNLTREKPQCTHNLRRLKQQPYPTFTVPTSNPRVPFVPEFATAIVPVLTFHQPSRTLPNRVISHVVVSESYPHIRRALVINNFRKRIRALYADAPLFSK